MIWQVIKLAVTLVYWLMDLKYDEFVDALKIIEWNIFIWVRIDDYLINVWKIKK
jgi:hypothetical protein